MFLAANVVRGMGSVRHRWFSVSAVQRLGQIDKLQLEALKEQCLLVDENDKVIGTASKRECHLVQKNGTIPLHRAFSVLLFNERGDFMLQKRSLAKITYPDCYTNACCSHPLKDYPGEDEETDAIGVRRAAQRRLHHELGVPLEQIPPERFMYLTRFIYFDVGNGKWGEHEIDYVLVLRANLDIRPNPDEVNEISFVPQGHMGTFVRELHAPLTPWFQLILKYKLFPWWDSLDTIQQFADHSVIHKFKQ